MKSGKLREDLYYRLNVFAIELPPLRERKEDLPLLSSRSSRSSTSATTRPCRRSTPAAMRILEQYNWPGNVRELRNVIERAVILCQRRVHRAEAPAAAGRPTRPDVGQADAVARRRAPRSRKPSSRLILMTLEHTRDNKTRAAEILGISLKTLHNKLNKLRGRVRRRQERSRPNRDSASRLIGPEHRGIKARSLV